MNIENIVFSNIQKIDFFPDLIDSKIVNKMKIELIRQNKSDANYFKIYFSKLMKKYNNDNDLICKHIFNVFLPYFLFYLGLHSLYNILNIHLYDNININLYLMYHIFSKDIIYLLS